MTAKKTPLGDTSNLMFRVVEGYTPPEDGFTDDEVARILGGQALVAAVETFHLPGRHDQDKHGHDGGTSGSSSGKKIKITHMLVHKSHGKPGDVLAVNGDGTKRVQWDGKKYLLQSKKDGGWTTESTAIKSKAYVEVNKFDSDWREPGTGDTAAEVTQKPQPTTPEVVPAPTPEPTSKPAQEAPAPAKPGTYTALQRSQVSRHLRQARS